MASRSQSAFKTYLQTLGKQASAVMEVIAKRSEKLGHQPQHCNDKSPCTMTQTSATVVAELGKRQRKLAFKVNR